MNKRIVLVHGWGGSPRGCWLPWLKQELEKKGFEVIVPQMPNTNEPKIETWVPFLEKELDGADENTYFIGHSIGCQTILRYLQSLPGNVKVGGVLLVAGFVNLTSVVEEDEEDYEVAQPWLETPLNWEDIAFHCNKFTAIFSDNDPWVPLDDSEIFKENLNAKILVEHNQDHFNAPKHQIILSELLKMLK
jgi:predicted alpha/beta hydrolase family esterase